VKNDLTKGENQVEMSPIVKLCLLILNM
jgi:hypothetical protein